MTNKDDNRTKKKINFHAVFLNLKLNYGEGKLDFVNITEFIILQMKIK